MVSIKLRYIREVNRIYRSILHLFWKIQGRDAARVYMFHSVVDTPEQVYSKFAITKDSYERFIKHELSRGQKPMDAETLKKAVDNPDAYPNHVVITFDDIYDTVYTNAYPVLKANKVPFVVFVTPALIDKIDSASKLPFITMDHLLEMAKDPLCIIGAHGMEHKMFRYYTEAEAKASMIESKQWLERNFSCSADFFAYPYGRRVEVSNVNIRTLSTCDFQCGFSAIDGSLKQKWFSGRWYLPRILVDEAFVQRSLEDVAERLQELV